MDVTVEDSAEVVDGCGIDRFIFAQAINGGAGNVVLVDQRVCGFSGLLQGSPERLVCNHAGSPILIRLYNSIKCRCNPDHSRKDDYIEERLKM